jgi:hypothetical protein
MKRTIALFILFLGVISICLGQTDQTENVVITTYYPSPAGVYNTLRLSPTDSAPSGAYTTRGTLYYNSTQDTIKYYNKTDCWVNLTGGTSAGGYWAYNSSNQAINNTNVTSDGTVVISGNDTTNKDVLKVYGDMRIQGQAGNDDAALYIVRRVPTNSSGLRFYTNQTPEDQYQLWLTGNPGYFAIGNKSVNFMEIERDTGKLTIGGAIDTGLTKTKLHIIGDLVNNPSNHTALRLEGDGQVTWDIRSSYGHGGYLMPWRSRGTYAAPSVIQAGDSIVYIKAYGYNGTDYNVAAGIRISANKTFSGTLRPARFAFLTTPAGSTTPVERLVSTSDVRIGIGESNPQYPLQVRINGGVEGHMRSDNGAWEVTSDKRFKKNISGIEDALEKVLRVKGVRFDHLTDKPSAAKKGRYFGFIGQDLEKVMPELVETDDKGYKCVTYSKITPVLVEAIKENQKEIESLRKEIEALKAQK